MELEILAPDWGLPATDTNTLKILAYAKFSGAPIQCRPQSNPFWTPNGQYPVFHHAGKKLTEFHDIFDHLRECQFSADYNLTPKQLAEVSAFEQLITEKLAPGLSYLFWVDAKNQIEMTRPWYGKHLSFPFGLYYINRYHREATEYIQSLYGHCIDDEEVTNNQMIETLIYRNAEECLTLLSNRLGDQQFMFGKSPSSLDAIMYSFLALLLKAPLPNPALQNYLKACDNLVAFVVRITHNYFPQVSLEYERQSRAKGDEERTSQSEGTSTAQEPENEYTKTNQIMAGVVATGAMLGYAYSSGLMDAVRNIRIVTMEDEEDDENEEDEGDEYE